MIRRYMNLPRKTSLTSPACWPRSEFNAHVANTRNEWIKPNIGVISTTSPASRHSATCSLCFLSDHTGMGQPISTWQQSFSSESHRNPDAFKCEMAVIKKYLAVGALATEMFSELVWQV